VQVLQSGDGHEARHAEHLVTIVGRGTRCKRRCLTRSREKLFDQEPREAV
jgi:hypothetical protein